MNKLSLNKIFTQNQKVLIPFITAGYPRLSSTLPIMQGLAENNCQIIELGIPFSDPMADGPVIEAASNLAIENGVNLEWLIDLVHHYKKNNIHTAIVLMGYYNSLEQYARGNIQKFVKDAKRAGINGVLIVDAPFEESIELYNLLNSQGIDLIRLIAPTTPIKRILKIVKYCSGYLYYVSLKGVTGSGAIDINSVKQQIHNIKRYVDLPIAVGFGIKNSFQVKEILSFSNGVVIGSKLIKIINQNIQKNDNEITKKICDFIKTLD